MTPEDFQKIRPRAVNVNSEMSSAAQRKYLGEKLHTFVFDDYFDEELTRIASQCRHLNYHLFEDINYVEIVDDHGDPVPEGTVGNIVGTNLHNRAMPFLRYVQGDRAAIRSTSCPCGRTFRILEKLEGRSNDAFALPGGEQLSSGFLLELSDLCRFPRLRWGCEQLLPHPGGPRNLGSGNGARLALERDSESEQRIPRELEQKLGRPSIRIVPKRVDQVTRTSSGKANPIISRSRRPAGFDVSALRTQRHAGVPEHVEHHAGLGSRSRAAAAVDDGHDEQDGDARQNDVDPGSRLEPQAKQQAQKAENKRPVAFPHRSVIAPRAADLDRDDAGHFAHEGEDHDQGNEPRRETGYQGQGKIECRIRNHVSQFVEYRPERRFHRVLAASIPSMALRAIRTKSTTGKKRSTKRYPAKQPQDHPRREGDERRQHGHLVCP